MPHRILVAPDKFKGSLTAPAAAQAIGDGIRDALPDAEIVLRPIADGGDGTAETLHAALGGSWVHVPGVADPLGRPIEARYLWIGAAAASRTSPEPPANPYLPLPGALPAHPR